MNWHTEKRKINTLIPFENNPRQMSEKQVKDLQNSLKKFNIVEIPAINTDDTIIAGHQRLKLLQLAGRGEEDIDVRIPDRELTTGEVEEYNVRSNKNTGSWDFDILANKFDVEKLIDFGFEKWEFGIEETEKIIDQIKDIGQGEEIECPKCHHKWKREDENSS